MGLLHHITIFPDSPITNLPNILFLIFQKNPVNQKQYLTSDKQKNLPEFNLCKTLLILTDVELIPPQRPLSAEMVTTTFFLTSAPCNKNKTQGTCQVRASEKQNPHTLSFKATRVPYIANP